MPPKVLTRTELLRSWNASPYTFNFRHLLPTNKHHTQRFSFHEPKNKTIRPRDRIKYWNIVPGDQVRIIGQPERTIYEVLAINKLRNLVGLKIPSTSDNASAKNVQYSKLQLLVGHHEFELGKPPVPVFATRISTTQPKWNPVYYRWDWTRLAVITTPRLPGDPRDRLVIPWPKPASRRKTDPLPYDTLEDVVTEITYVPPVFIASTSLPLPKPPSEDEYINYLVDPEKSTLKSSELMELNLVKEVSNPHSRAKKQRRWQEKQEYKRNLLKQLIKAELSNAKGRNPREARAEATFKWRQKLQEERKAELKRIQQLRGDDVKLGKKRIRAAKKAERKAKRLENLVLQQGNNQVIPIHA